MKNSWRILPIVASAMTCMATVTPAFAMQQPHAIYEEAIAGNDTTGDTPTSNVTPDNSEEATEKTGKITISNPQKEEDGETLATYTAVKVFDVRYDDTKTKFSYTINEDDVLFDAVQKFADDENNGMKLTKVGDTKMYFVEETTDKFSADAFSKALASALTQDILEKHGKVGTPTEDKKAVVIGGLKLGYYIVHTTTPVEEGKVSICNLTTIKPDSTITDKNIFTNITKEIEQAESAAQGKAPIATSQFVGRKVQFDVKTTVPNAAAEITTPGELNKFIFYVTDTWTSGLDFHPETLEVTIGGKTLVKDQDYVLHYNSEESAKDGSKTFKVEFKNLITKEGKQNTDLYMPGDSVVIRYTSTLNENAVYTTSEVNIPGVTFGHTDTPHHEVGNETHVYDIDLDLVKVDKKDNTVKLDGAKFVMYQKVENGIQLYQDIQKDEKGNYVARWSETMSEEDFDAAVKSGDIAKMTTVKVSGEKEEGKLKFQGLKSGEYFVREIEAPKGYNLLTSDIKVNINPVYGDDGKLKTVEAKTTINKDTETNTITVTKEDGQPNIDGQIVVEKNVENTDTPELPSTGGMGTTLLTTAGVALMGGAFVVLTTKRRIARNSK